MDRAAGSFDLHQLNAQLGKAQSRAALMLQAIRTASGSLDLQQVLNRIAEIFSTATGVLHCGIYLLDIEQETLIHRAGTGLLDPMHTISPKMLHLDPVRFTCLREALMRREPVVCLDAAFESPTDLEFVGLLNSRAILGVPLAVGDYVLGMALICAMDEMHTFTSEEIELAWGVANAVALAVRNAQAYEELRQRLAESQSLQRVSSSLLHGASLPDLLHLVCTEAQHLTSAAGCIIFTVQENGWLHVVHSTGQPLPIHVRIPGEGSLSGLAVQRGVPILMNHQIPQEYWQFHSRDVQSMLVVPMRVGSSTIGVLDVMNKVGGFNSDDVRIISLFADQAALNLEYARLRQQAEQLAVVEERQRLARELHDSVTQSLYSTMLYADAAILALAAGKQDIATIDLHELRDTAQSAMRDMRLLIYQLHPPVLEKEGMVAALQGRLAAVETRAGLQTELRVDAAEERRLPLDVEQELYGIAQEALNNVVKHAQARSVIVEMDFHGDTVSLQIIDDGCGFDYASARLQGGMGLRNMEERAARIGAYLDLRSDPVHGTCVGVRVGIGMEKDSI